MQNLKINISPTRKELSQIKLWLLNERYEVDEGFYGNWNIIEDRFNSNELICIQNDTNILGFFVWGRVNSVAYIELFEIHPNHRKNGVGEYLFKNCIDFFIEKGCSVVELECMPRESEFFWKKNGFVNFPEICFWKSDLTLFRPFIKNLYPSDKKSEFILLEMWNEEPHQAKGKPYYLWNLIVKNNSTKLLEPIIQPCNGDWKMRLIKNEQIMFEGKVKQFSSGGEYSCDFFIMSELKC